MAEKLVDSWVVMMVETTDHGLAVMKVELTACMRVVPWDGLLAAWLVDMKAEYWVRCSVVPSVD